MRYTPEAPTHINAMLPPAGVPESCSLPRLLRAVLALLSLLFGEFVHAQSES